MIIFWFVFVVGVSGSAPVEAPADSTATTVADTVLRSVLDNAEAGVRHPRDVDDDSIKTWLAENAENRHLAYCRSEGLGLDESTVLEPIREILKSVPQTDDCADIVIAIGGVRPAEFFITKFELVKLRWCLRAIVDNAEKIFLTSSKFVDGLRQIITIAYNPVMDELLIENVAGVNPDGGFVLFRANLVQLCNSGPGRRSFVCGDIVTRRPEEGAADYPPSALSIIESREITLDQAKAVMFAYVDFDHMEKEYLIERSYSLTEAMEIWDNESYIGRGEFENWQRVIGRFFFGLYRTNKDHPGRLPVFQECFETQLAEPITIGSIFDFLVSRYSAEDRIRIYKRILTAVLDDALMAPDDMSFPQVSERLVYLMRMTSNGFAYIVSGGYEI